MKVGLLIIATEILEGKILDLNGRFLSDFLKPFELEVLATLTVRDDEREIQRGLKYLLEECDLILTSGGLGPTKDDLTKEVIGRFLGRKSSFSLDADRVASENYARMGRTYPGPSHVYSTLPEGFVALSNSTGFAPGLFCEHFDKHILSAPGVPREFKSILEDHLGPWLERKLMRDRVMENVVVRTRRVPEEKIFGELDPELWNRLAELGDVSSLPVLMGVNIGVKIRAKNKEELEEKKRTLRQTIEASPVLSCVWHWGPEKLEEVIVARAKAKGLTFGFAESCTGGLCAHRITGVSGSSSCFFGAVVSYDTGVKESVLNVPTEVVKTAGVVSTQTAEAMALGTLRVLNVDIAVSTTGIAGPTGGTEENPVGTVCIGVAFRGKSHSNRYVFRGDRDLLKERFSEAALMALLDAVENFAP